MKPPKNFYSNLDRRKQGLPEVPEASAADAGKVIKVGSDGDYELGADVGLPAVSSADNGKLLQVRNNEWGITSKPDVRSILLTNSVGNIISTRNMGVYISYDGTTISRQIFGYDSLHSTLKSFVSNSTLLTMFNINGTIFVGFYCSTESNAVIFVAWNTDGSMFKITVSDSAINLEQISGLKYYEITASGSSVSLPSGVTFADVYAELQAGVDVKFTSGARVYSVTSFESTNIRAHWMSDLDLTSMEVYVINLASDGTGTVASATFSGS